jgi:hypothetical protein
MKQLFLLLSFVFLGSFAKEGKAQKPALDSLWAKLPSPPEGYFLKESLAVGEPVRYVLSLRYPTNWQVLFPDSLYDYSPFELIQKHYFSTRSSEGFSTDSVVYELRSFEMSERLSLRLPVFVLLKGDSLPLFPRASQMYLKRTLPLEMAIDSLSPRADTELIPIPLPKNYPLQISLWLLALVLLVLGWLLFGKRIRRQLRLLELRRKYRNFEESFNKKINVIQQKQQVKDIEQALFLWKMYLEEIDKKPYSSFTSKEIIREGGSHYLEESLLSIDKAIYGQIIEANLPRHLVYLRRLARRKYINKKEEILQA